MNLAHACNRGRLYNYFNNKILYLAAFFIFEVGSALIGSAQSIEAVIAGRTIAGWGGSGVYVGTMKSVKPSNADRQSD